MPRKKTQPARAGRADAAREILIGLRTLTDYRPPSPDLSIEAAAEIETRLLEAEQEVIKAQAVLDEGRARRDVLRVSMQGIIQRIKYAVTLQYGRDSSVLKLFSLRKWADRNSRPRHRATEEAA
jgi:hypothetical protein